ncbi:unnamed protein product [Rhizophagus irregularis]|uniref:Peptidase S8/S53 domain-containing protein n=1 Tax=Rhizophagus irregularis TaxID=588596 RepID=A0A915ZL97_9GLOM|nr:unnamed protein product [Rhizophagus irregularis]
MELPSLLELLLLKYLARKEEGPGAILSLTGKYFPLANAAIRAFIDLGIHWSVRRDLFASGTSMVSPHVAGVIALIISQRGNMAPAKMKELLKSMATYGALKNVELTASNIILYVNKSI